ncbi:MAG: iron-containing alcohol dehydrogenase [Lachnospiraceae bacterium]|jgi:alcohol dehydrogenase YqhD (iron-dependent ADH family)|nr:iron-containing alcohol dehydrogenase [Lachnospiraceae bacterium]
MKKFRDYRMHLYPEYVVGEGVTKEVGKLIKKHGGTKVLVVGYGADVIPDLYAVVRQSLTEEGLPFVEVPGVIANPRRTLVDKAVQLAKDEKIDFVLGLGGGSSTDSCKAIAWGACYDGDWWDFYSRKASPTKKLPVGIVNTIAGSGSETSKASVILDDVDTKRKMGLNSESARPVFAIEDPVNSYTLPPIQTAIGGIDVLSHTFDCFFSPFSSMLSDEWASGLMRTVVHFLPIAVAEPTNYEARFQLMLCCPFAINGITTIGRQYPSPGASASHPLETVSSVYDKQHGQALAIIMPAILQRFVDEGDAGVVSRVADFGNRVFGVPIDLQDLKATANEGIRRFHGWIRGFGLPKTFTELGLPPEAPEVLAEEIHYGKDGKLDLFLPMTKDEVIAFYKSLM